VTCADMVHTNRPYAPLCTAFGSVHGIGTKPPFQNPGSTTEDSLYGSLCPAQTRMGTHSTAQHHQYPQTTPTTHSCCLGTDKTTV